MKRMLPVIGLFALAACSSSTDPGSDETFAGLIGRWRSASDTAWSLTVTRACCGDKPALEGVLRHGESRVELEALSGANLYPIAKPDSASPPEYAIALALAVHLDGVCAIDGLVRDRGRDAFPYRAIPDSADLALTFASSTATGCDSLWEPMTFFRSP